MRPVSAPGFATLPLYPEPPPLRAWRLPASGGHALQVREWGAADGLPALVLHGGPGSGGSPFLARFFDPRRYRVVCPDQRGAGASLPAGGTAHNTTADLLADLRRLRAALGIERWLVVGGSWGAALGLLHALDEPRAAAGLLLRGVFLGRPADVEAFFDAPSWRPWRPAAGPLVEELDRVMRSGSAEAQAALARQWWRHEQSMQEAAAGSAAGPEGDAAVPPTSAPSATETTQTTAATGTADRAAVPPDRAGTVALSPPPSAEPPLPALLQRYRVQAHYLRHGCWLDAPPLLDRLQALAPRPLLLLHGALDRVCPPAGALALRRRLPWARLRIVEGAGHAPTHPAMAAAMVRALDAWAAGDASFGMEGVEGGEAPDPAALPAPACLPASTAQVADAAAPAAVLPAPAHPATCAAAATTTTAAPPAAAAGDDCSPAARP